MCVYEVIHKITQYKLIYHVADKEISKLSHRQKQRAQKRSLKNQQLQKKNTKILLKKEANFKEEQIQLKKVCIFI